MAGRSRRLLHDNGLSIAAIALFLAFLCLQALSGWQARNEELAQAGLPGAALTLSLPSYLASGHFLESLFENWESEFLQMGAYVLLTAYLVQRGSPESKPLDQGDRPEDAPGSAPAGFLRRNGLSIAFSCLFLLSFLAHLVSGTAAYNEEQALQTGDPPVSVLVFLATPDFWFESMQNWQSEFLAVASLVLLGIFLRQHGSPQSKPVAAPHSQTGEGG